jgi:hypothetical protein
LKQQNSNLPKESADHPSKNASAANQNYHATSHGINASQIAVLSKLAKDLIDTRDMLGRRIRLVGAGDFLLSMIIC